MSPRRKEPIRYRLLLVEDQRHSIDELRELFTELGYECEVALDLETARGILGNRLMDLAVVSMGVPGVSDQKVIREFKGLDAEMPLVIYKGVKSKARQRKLRRAGADSYLSTASDLRAVARAVHKVLQGR